MDEVDEAEPVRERRGEAAPATELATDRKTLSTERTLGACWL